MRQISEWTREDLQAIVDAGEPEGIHREYKASTLLHRDRTDELTKAVTAFANSDGGILIFGIVESNGKPPVPTGIDDGVGPGGMSRETMDQLLVSNISPPIAGVIITEIELSPGRRTFAVQVPRGSPTAPHQASDKRYYRRYNFMSQPMHDFDVRNLMNRKSISELARACTAKIVELPENDDVEIALLIWNESSEPSVYTLVSVQVIGDSIGVSLAGWSTYPVEQVCRHSKWHPSRRLTKNLMPPGSMPIFRGVKFSTGTMSVSVPQSDFDFLIQFETTCPGFSGTSFYNARRTDGTFSFSEIAYEQSGLADAPSEFQSG